MMMSKRAPEKAAAPAAVTTKSRPADAVADLERRLAQLESTGTSSTTVQTPPNATTEVPSATAKSAATASTSKNALLVRASQSNEHASPFIYCEREKIALEND
jgi:hypothetical protein